MSKQSFHLFIYFYNGKVIISPTAFHIYGTNPEQYSLLGETDVEIDVPEYNETEIQIASLERAIESEISQSNAKINYLLERISNLRALTHEVQQ